MLDNVSTFVMKHRKCVGIFTFFIVCILVYKSGVNYGYNSKDCGKNPIYIYIRVRVMVFNATLNNSSVISWRPNGCIRYLNTFSLSQR
jgi:hypothetical protein